MKVSRRDFLSTAAGSAATLASFRFNAWGRAAPRPNSDTDCILLDLKSHCFLRESLLGYQAALPAGHNCVPDALSDSPSRCRIVIVPGLGSMEAALAQTLSESVAAGAHLLLESGAAFATPAEFAAHQRILHRYFDLQVKAPVALWSTQAAEDASLSRRSGRHPKTDLARGSIPYVNYHWPRETKIRDFSRVVPVSPQSGDVIGTVGALPVALKRHTKGGTLIFLGCPLGPALRVGDAEAHSWLRSAIGFPLAEETTSLPIAGSARI